MQKLTYLRAQLRGDAARVIAGFQLTNDNYANSVTLLRDRFGLTYKLVDAHFQALRDLSSPSNNLASLREFRDSTEGHIRSLATLGKPEDSYGSFLVTIIFGKLSAKTKQNLVRSNPKKAWSITELQAAILDEINILEIGSEQQTPQATPQHPFMPVPRSQLLQHLPLRASHTVHFAPVSTSLLSVTQSRTLSDGVRLCARTDSASIVSGTTGCLHATHVIVAVTVRGNTIPVYAIVDKTVAYQANPVILPVQFNRATALHLASLPL